MIKKPIVKKDNELKGHSEIDRFIEKGGSFASEGIKKDVIFTINVPGELCKIIDELRAVIKMSRRSWLLQAAQEKIQREKNTDIKFVQKYTKKVYKRSINNILEILCS